MGSFISLTSGFDIRYEGILYNISTEESTIGLNNVRSFGTERRRKDGPQIPPTDKVYEYILFRGSDIKQYYSQPSLQVPYALKLEWYLTRILMGAPGLPGNSLLQTSQPSTQSPAPANAPIAGNGTVPDLTSNTAPSLPRSTFQGGLPLYQSGLNMGLWGSSPGMPNANSTV